MLHTRPWILALILLAIILVLMGSRYRHAWRRALPRLPKRMSVAALTRRTWATAQTATGMQRQIHWWRAYYHFIRPHLSLRHCGRACTPAMAASLTGHRWTATEFLGYPCAQSG